MYVLRIEDGILEWKFETGEAIKSTPFINPENGYVYFGCHDKQIYCLDVDVKINVLKTSFKFHHSLNRFTLL